MGQVFERMIKGASRVADTDYPGELYEHADGVRVGIRAASRSGGPTIDIFGLQAPVKVHL